MGSPPLARSRRAAARALLLAALVVLSACGDATAPRAGAPGVTLVFKHAKILGRSDPVPGLLARFEASHPGIRVRSEVLPWNADEQHQFLAINLEGGRPGFDVMMLDVIWVPEFARAGWLLDLTSWVPPAELAPHFRAAVAAGERGGRLWALPWFTNVGVLYYRADLLARHGLRPPGTWDELVAQVRRIRAAEGDPTLDGVLWQGKQYEGLVVNALEALWANGTSVLGADGRVFPDEARAVEALSFLRELVTSGISPAWVSAADEELSRRPFGQGRAIFLRSWPYAMDLFEEPGSAVRGRVGIAPLPRHRHGERGAGSTGGAHLGVQRYTAHPEAAAALVRFLASADAQRELAAAAALNPTHDRLYDDPDLVRARPYLPGLRELLRQARPRPVTPAYLVISSTLQPELSAVVVGTATPAQAVARARHRLAYFLEGLE
jgi:multiple sugar transport system substrate-binding protein